MPLGMPPGTRYASEQALATVMGPRDEAWLEAAIADPRVALDITPWWVDATDARYLLNRALVLMWLEVRWRTPAVEGEADLFDEVHRLLSRAYPIDPDLPYPWHAWTELTRAARRRRPDGPPGGDPARAKEPEPEPPVGYRRDPVRITHENWSLEMPGEYAERRSADEWWGGGAGRSITLAATTTGDGRRCADVGAGVHEQFAADLGPDAITHQAGGVLGRARLMTDASSGRGGRRPRGLRRGHRLRRGDPHRVRRPGRLAVGARHVEVAGAGLSRAGPSRAVCASTTSRSVARVPAWLRRSCTGRTGHLTGWAVGHVRAGLKRHDGRSRGRTPVPPAPPVRPGARSPRICTAPAPDRHFVS